MNVTQYEVESSSAQYRVAAAVRGASCVKLFCENFVFFDSCFSTFPGVRGHTVLVPDSRCESSWDRASNRAVLRGYASAHTSSMLYNLCQRDETNRFSRS